MDEMYIILAVAAIIAILIFIIIRNVRKARTDKRAAQIIDDFDALTDMDKDEEKAQLYGKLSAEELCLLYGILLNLHIKKDINSKRETDIYIMRIRKITGDNEYTPLYPEEDLKFIDLIFKIRYGMDVCQYRKING